MIDGKVTGHPKLGRVVQFDEKSREYPIRQLLSAAGAQQPRSKVWPCRVHLNQGQIPACVGMGWAHEIAAEPIVDPITEALALSIYTEAQPLDGAPLPHDGSSVLAGAKIMQRRGYLGEYRWAFGLQDVIMALAWTGPVVLGLPWYEGMMATDWLGQIHPTGRMIGGHCILAKGVNVSTKMITLHQSWGVTWGIGGDCSISFADLDRLLHEQGEACVPVQRTHPTAQAPTSAPTVKPATGPAVVAPQAAPKPAPPAAAPKPTPPPTPAPTAPVPQVRRSIFAAPVEPVTDHD